MLCTGIFEFPRYNVDEIRDIPGQRVGEAFYSSTEEDEFTVRVANSLDEFARLVEASSLTIIPSEFRKSL